MDFRCRLPGALYRLAVQRAADEGSDLQTIIRRLLESYVEGASPAAQLGRLGGAASAAALSPEARRAKALAAAAARWRDHDPSP